MDASGKRVRLISTEAFTTIARESITKDFNRLPSDEILENLDPDGVHVLEISMPHNHRHGEAVEEHVRTLWWMKLIGEDKPVPVFLDMTMERFNTITDYAWVAS